MFPTYQALKRFLARLRDPPKASDTRNHTPFGNTQSITLQSFSLVCSVSAVADLSRTQKVRDTKRWGLNPRREGGIPGGGTQSGFIRGCAAPGSEPLPYFRENRTPKTYPILGKSHNPRHPKRAGLQKHNPF